MFCFNCGFLGHRFRQCSLPLSNQDAPKNLPYGSWMTGVDSLRSHQLLSVQMMGDDGTEQLYMEPNCCATGDATASVQESVHEEVGSGDSNHVNSDGGQLVPNLSQKGTFSEGSLSTPSSAELNPPVSKDNPG